MPQVLDNVPRNLRDKLGSREYPEAIRTRVGLLYPNLESVVLIRPARRLMASVLGLIDRARCIFDGKDDRLDDGTKELNGKLEEAHCKLRMALLATPSPYRNRSSIAFRSFEAPTNCYSVGGGQSQTRIEFATHQLKMDAFDLKHDQYR